MSFSIVHASRIPNKPIVLFLGCPNPAKDHRGGGVYDLRMDRGLPPGFSQRYPLLITETCCHTHFYDEF